MAVGQYVRHALHSGQIAGKLNQDPEVVFGAQEKHGLTIRYQQEQEKTESDDEQHH